MPIANEESTGNCGHELRLTRDLGLFDVTMIGVGAMIGAGIFVLTGIAAGAAGPALILSFALNAVITVFTAMVYAELGSAIPEAGGGYLWVREGLPGPNAFLAGWMSWFAHAVAGSLYGLGFGAYLRLVLSETNVPLLGVGEATAHKIFAVAVILAFLYVNYRGSSETGLIGNIITSLKIAVLLVFIGSGLAVIIGEPSNLDNFRDFAPEGAAGILNAMGLTFIAFEGYEIIVQAGEETRNPRETIPKAVFYSLAIVVPIYMLVAFVSIGAVEPDSDIPTYQWLGQHKELGLVEAARQFMPFGTVLLLAGGLFSTMSALNATTYSSTRVAFAMGRDKNLPNVFGRISDRTHTPYRALAFSGGLILFMALAIPIEDVASAADIMFLLLFLQVNVAVISIRRRYGDRLRYGYRMAFFPAIPIIGIVTKLFLAVFMYNYSPVAWYFTGGWIVVGLGAYYFYAREHRRGEEQAPVLETRKRGQDDQDLFTVLVPIANPDSVDLLLYPAVKAARERDGRVVVLHAVEVPRQLPVSAGSRYRDRSRRLLDAAIQRIEEVPAEGIVRIAHHAAKAIIDTAHESDADLMILGWRGERRNPDTTIGSEIDDVVQQVNCDVLILQQNGRPPFDRILVSIERASDVSFALEAAAALSSASEMCVDIIHVFKPGSTDSEQASFQEKIDKRLERFREEHSATKLSVSFLARVSRDSISAIVETGGDYDAVLAGTSKDYWLKRLFLRNAPSRIARRLEPPVILYRPRTSAIGFSFRRLSAFIRGSAAGDDAGELEEEGILVDEARPPRRPLGRPALLGVGAGGLAGVTMTAVGGGNWLSMAGVAIFLAALAGFTWISKRAVENEEDFSQGS